MAVAEATENYEDDQEGQGEAKEVEIRAARMDPGDMLMTSMEVMAYLRISESTLRNYIRDGDLHPYRLKGSKGRILRFRRRDVETMLVPMERPDQGE